MFASPHKQFLCPEFPQMRRNMLHH